MKDARLVDYLSHMQQAAQDACDFVDGLAVVDFIEDKRTQQAVIMSLIIIGEAVTKILEVVWATVQTALPELLTQLVAVRQDAEKLTDGD